VAFLTRSTRLAVCSALAHQATLSYGAGRARGGPCEGVVSEGVLIGKRGVREPQQVSGTVRREAAFNCIYIEHVAVMRGQDWRTSMTS
jgi:hypothetical protein